MFYWHAMSLGLSFTAKRLIFVELNTVCHLLTTGGKCTMGRGSWVMRVTGQRFDGSHVSWVTNDDPLSSLVELYPLSHC